VGKRGTLGVEVNGRLLGQITATKPKSPETPYIISSTRPYNREEKICLRSQSKDMTIMNIIQPQWLTAGQQRTSLMRDMQNKTIYHYNKRQFAIGYWQWMDER
jgi:hypothetical protein